MYLLTKQHHVTLYLLLHKWTQPSGVILCSTIQGKTASIFRAEKAPLVDMYSYENLNVTGGHSDTQCNRSHSWHIKSVGYDWLTVSSRILLVSDHLLSQWTISLPRYIIMLKGACHLCVTWARWIQSTLFHSISWSSITILSSKWLFPSCSPTTSLLPHTHHVPHDFQPHWSLRSLVSVQTQTDLPVQKNYVRRILMKGKGHILHFTHLWQIVTSFEQDLVVELLPQCIICRSNSKLSQARSKQWRHSRL